MGLNVEASAHAVPSQAEIITQVRGKRDQDGEGTDGGEVGEGYYFISGRGYSSPGTRY